MATGGSGSVQEETSLAKGLPVKERRSWNSPEHLSALPASPQNVTGLNEGLVSWPQSNWYNQANVYVVETL